MEPQRRTERPLQRRGRERRQRLHGNTAKWSEWSAEVTLAPRVNITGVFFSFFPKIKLLTRRVQRRPIIFHENGNSRAGQIASWVVLSWIQEKHFCLKDSELVPKPGLSCLLTTQEQFLQQGFEKNPGTSLLSPQTRPAPLRGAGTAGGRAQRCQAGPARPCMPRASQGLGPGLQAWLVHSVPLSLKTARGYSMASVPSRVPWGLCWPAVGGRPTAARQSSLQGQAQPCRSDDCDSLSGECGRHRMRQ